MSWLSGFAIVAQVGFIKEEKKIQYFNQWDAASKWLGKETLYFVRAEMGTS